MSLLQMIENETVKTKAIPHKGCACIALILLGNTGIRRIIFATILPAALAFSPSCDIITLKHGFAVKLTLENASHFCFKNIVSV